MASAIVPGQDADGTYSQNEALGEPLTITDNLGRVSHLRFDSRGDLAQRIDPTGNEWDWTFNIANQTLTMAAPATGQTGSGRTIGSIIYQYPGGTVASTHLYNESGTQVRQISYTYGLDGERLSVSGSTEPVTLTYDALLRKTSLTDGDNHATYYYYNAAGYLDHTVYPDSTQVQYPSYNTAGQLLESIDARGLERDFAYDSAGALHTVTFPTSTTLNSTATYDGYGRTVGLSDASGSKSYAYGDLNEATSITTTYTGLTAQTLSYSYNPDGSRASMSTPAGNFSYGYDAGQRPTSITNPYSETTTWTYLNNDWLQTQTLANGVMTTPTYNAAGQVTQLLNQLGTGTSATTLSEFGSIGFDGAGNRLAVTASLPAASDLSGVTDYSYDSRNQLTSESSTRIASAGGYSNSFAYDTAGNATTFRGATFAYTNTNEISGTGYAYDNSGNPTTYNGVSFTYDALGKATQIGSALSAGYSIDGHRVWKQNGSSIRTYFLYDGMSPILEMNSSGSVTAVNTWGVDGLISRHTLSGSTGASVFYTFDERGNTAQRLDASGNVLTSHLADAFGATTTVVSSGVTYANDDPYDGFGAQHGYYTDHETGFVLCGQRYYTPATGRWLTRDPSGYGGGINLYSYCGNNAVMESDACGLCANHGPGNGFNPDENDGGGDYGNGSYDDSGTKSGHPGMYAGTPQSNWAKQATKQLEATLVTAAVSAATGGAPEVLEEAGAGAAASTLEDDPFAFNYGPDEPPASINIPDEEEPFDRPYYHYSNNPNLSQTGIPYDEVFVTDLEPTPENYDYITELMSGERDYGYEVDTTGLKLQEGGSVGKSSGAGEWKMPGPIEAKRVGPCIKLEH